MLSDLQRIAVNALVAEAAAEELEQAGLHEQAVHARQVCNEKLDAWDEEYLR